MNRFRKVAQNFEDFLYDYDPEKAKERDSQSWKYFKLILRNCYEQSKLVDQWVLPEDWTTNTAKMIKKIYDESVAYNTRYKAEMLQGKENDLKAPEQRKIQPNEKAKPLLDRINQIKNIGI